MLSAIWPGTRESLEVRVVCSKLMSLCFHDTNLTEAVMLFCSGSLGDTAEDLGSVF